MNGMGNDVGDGGLTILDRMKAAGRTIVDSGAKTMLKVGDMDRRVPGCDCMASHPDSFHSTTVQ